MAIHSKTRGRKRVRSSRKSRKQRGGKASTVATVIRNIVGDERSALQKGVEAVEDTTSQVFDVVHKTAKKTIQGTGKLLKTATKGVKGAAGFKGGNIFDDAVGKTTDIVVGATKKVHDTTSGLVDHGIGKTTDIVVGATKGLHNTTTRFLKKSADTFGLAGGNPYSTSSIMPGGDSILPRATMPSTPRATMPSTPRSLMSSTPRSLMSSTPRPLMPSTPRPLMPSTPRPLMSSTQPLEQKSVLGHMTGHVKTAGNTLGGIVSKAQNHPIAQGVINHPVTRRAKNVWNALTKGGKRRRTRKSRRGTRKSRRGGMRKRR